MSWVRRRRGVLALAVLLALVTGIALAVQLPHASPPVATAVMPGSFTGYAFDTCEAPSQRQMDAWREHSPYAAVGIYIAGESRGCPRQRHLDAAWVATQAARGWRLLPLSVGPQAPCSQGTHSARIDPSPAARYAAARGQGRDVATDAAAAARDLGIARGSTLWLDVESFDISRTRCRDATLAYVSSWTRMLRTTGYASGFYSSASTGIRMLQQARAAAPGTVDVPQQIWVGDWNQRHDSGSVKKARDGWPGGRVHQYAGSHRETYGGVTLRIDSNFMDVGHGTVAPTDRTRCPRDLGYPTLRQGDRSRSVPVLQCLLGQRRLLRGDTSSRYYSSTARAVTDLQRSSGLRPTGVVDRRTWMVLLSGGPRPLLKYGSAGDAVRRLQRTLGAAGSTGISATGVFEEHTRAAVVGYQRAHHLTGTGVVTTDVWQALQSGR
jgi:peptidoglycan hydrolase-like protein with peptidoglycan-binding domain